VTVAVGIISSSWCDFLFVNPGPADDRSAVRLVLEMDCQVSINQPNRRTIKGYPP
jgi:hypothetical protein